MHYTTLVVLAILVSGQFFVLGCAGLVLWLAGEFGDPPNWRGLRHERKSSDAEMRQNAAAIAPAAKEALHRLSLSPDLIDPCYEGGESVRALPISCSQATGLSDSRLGFAAGESS